MAASESESLTSSYENETLESSSSELESNSDSENNDGTTSGSDSAEGSSDGIESDDNSSNSETSIAVTRRHPSESLHLFPQSQINLFESHILLFQYFTKYQLSNKGLDKLLQLLKLHMPKQTTGLPSSGYKLKKFLHDLFPDLISCAHYYCSVCHQLLAEGTPACINPDCAGSDTECFISVSLQAQLKRRLEGVIQDVYDGMEYQKHRVFLSSPCNLSFACNTDGVAIFSSSSVSIWPVWLCINELPCSERFVSYNSFIREYGSTLYVGMTRGKNGGRIKRVH